MLQVPYPLFVLSLAEALLDELVLEKKMENSTEFCTCLSLFSGRLLEKGICLYIYTFAIFFSATICYVAMWTDVIFFSFARPPYIRARSASKKDINTFEKSNTKISQFPHIFKGRSRFVFRTCRQ